MPFSKRITHRGTLNTLTLSLHRLREERVPILNLTESNPTRADFLYLKEDLLKYFRNTQALQYEPELHGLLVAREAVCRYYAEKGISLDPHQIFLTASTSEAYAFVFRLLMDRGSALLAPQPSYPLLEFLADFNEVEIRRYPLLFHKKDGWGPHLEDLETTSLVKALLLVHPNNPTGNYFHDATAMERICGIHGAALISDEVFLDYALDRHLKPKSFALTNHGLTFTLSGISKVLGLPQMKLSWIVVTGPEKKRNEAIQKLEIMADIYLSVSTPIQLALPHWFQKKEEIQSEILERVRENLAFLKEMTAKNERMDLYPPEGGWSAVLQLPASRSDEAWALELLEKHHVLTHPGYLFDFEEGSFLVVSLLPPPAIFQEGVKRISRIF